VRADFIGLDVRYPLADGAAPRRVYLDSAASTLMLGAAQRTSAELLRHHANTHSSVHASARTCTEAYRQARARVLSFVGADADAYVCLFVGNGATGALNRAAYYLRARRPQPQAILVSLMEHHSNDLPHRAAGLVRHVPLQGSAPDLGAIDVDAFTAMLRAEPVRYAAVTMASNVTGIVNPVARLAAAAHAAGVPLLVDASQAIAHLPVRMADLGWPDALVFSGHKAYAPGSPGVLVVRRSLLDGAPPLELGGGMVSHVDTRDVTLATDPCERHEAGTPHVIGAVTLAAALEVLGHIGMDVVAHHERALTGLLLEQLRAIPGLRLYGAAGAGAARVGVVAFNLGELEHGVVAAALNDLFGIAVRNGCFCAHPYVRAMLAPELWGLDVPSDPVEAERVVARRRGMVRASLGLYTTPEDIAALLAALHRIQARPVSHLGRYRVDETESRLTGFDPPVEFDLASTVRRSL
jgi:selenocysteine lyase/cysteine desulfurase